MILAIETSCDETALALVGASPDAATRPRIVDEVISSQIKLHAQYGGVVPELAAREHLRALPSLLDELLRRNAAVLSNTPLSSIAVTTGPGLKGSLLMGVNFAKGYGLANGLAVEGVNHIEGHLLSPLINNPELIFPYLAVIVSGGHTEILEVRGVADYYLVERTTDDAAGEAFDKSAALLDIPYPGGAELSRLAGVFRAAAGSGSLAAESDPRYKVSASRGSLSFSGLKTSFRLVLERLKKSEIEVNRGCACAAVEEGIVETLTARVKAACESTGINRIGLSGGVAANGFLRKALALHGVVFGTELRWCGDNAAMIGFAAALRRGRGISAGSCEIRARWPVEEMSNYAR